MVCIDCLGGILYPLENVSRLEVINLDGLEAADVDRLEGAVKDAKFVTS